MFTLATVSLMSTMLVVALYRNYMVTEEISKTSEKYPDIIHTAKYLEAELHKSIEDRVYKGHLDDISKGVDKGGEGLSESKPSEGGNESEDGDLSETETDSEMIAEKMKNMKTRFHPKILNIETAKDEHKIIESLNASAMDKIVNMSSGIFDLIMGDAAKSKTMDPNTQEEANPSNNSAHVLSSLASYVFHQENQEIREIQSSSEIPNHEMAKDMKSKIDHKSPVLQKSGNAQAEKISQPASDVLQTDVSDDTTRITKTRTTPVHQDFGSYLQSIEWEVWVTITAIVVLILVLVAIVVAWGTQYMRKRKNRIRILNIRTNANIQTI